MSSESIAILGAGPYGLAAAAHLRSAGLEPRHFGRPMEFWKDQMPKGMFLRSSWDASHIADPDRTLTLNAYEDDATVRINKPVPLEDFVSYGRWFQRKVVPDLDSRRVTNIKREQAGFRFMLEDGESERFDRVIIAAGIAPFPNKPRVFDGLPASLVSHSVERCDLTQFADRQIVVIGGGQSAVESAAILSEAGAEVELISRSERLRWLRRSGWLHRRGGVLRDLLYPPTDVGPPCLNQIVARPNLFRRLPRGIQRRVAYRSIRPAAAGWLYDRVRGVHFTFQRSVVAARPEGQRLTLSLDDGTDRTVDHVLLSTGFRVDVSRYPFLDPSLTREIAREDGYPTLKTGFECSVRGLHFLGAPAAWSFGPLMRFVSGGAFAASALTSTIVGAL